LSGFFKKILWVSVFFGRGWVIFPGVFTRFDKKLDYGWGLVLCGEVGFDVRFGGSGVGGLLLS
jgi:hypothetical protein